VSEKKLRMFVTEKWPDIGRHLCPGKKITNPEQPLSPSHRRSGLRNANTKLPEHERGTWAETLEEAIPRRNSQREQL